MTRSASPTTSTSTASDCSPPPLGSHHPPSKAMLPPASSNFSPIPTSARPRRPLSPTSLRDVDIPLDPERAFAARGKYPVPPTGHELMALFPPAPPMIRLGSTSGFFEREERKFFAQAGKEIVRVRLEIDSALPHTSGGGGGGGPLPSSMTSPPNPHARHARTHSHGHPPPPPLHHDRAPPPTHAPLAPPPPPHATSPRSHLPPSAFPAPPPPVGSPMGPPPVPAGPAHPGYPISRPPDVERNPGGGSEAMVVEDDDDDNAWRRPTPHNARRRAGKHTRRVIVK
ncbi:hypothetical protein BD310DRAFT_816344 [Dichomitus squalens]|uniref:Uncharacterized protein n=1 Tax=Dichomitus squalens TaxID=114155 RepID=A0A4Q9PZ61_9APHY|nr:hypothetical protein BD310DRAFT_816344 [Dichomitus squalens]